MTDSKEQKPRSVLVVEDEVVIRWMAVSALEDAGYEVAEAGTAAEALEVLRSRRVDVLFTDVAMPGTMDGLDLVREVQQHWPDIAIIVTSGHIVPLRRQLPSDGVFIQKPYHFESVLRRIEGMAVPA